jgi:dUTP pyrophosphatase
MQLKLKKLLKDATLPEYKTTGAVAMDLVATSEQIDVKNGNFIYGTGIAIEVPAGYEAQVRPRSSIREKDIILINSPGTIDQDYRGEVMVTFKPLRPGARKYDVGERIAQLVIVPIVRVDIEVVEELSKTDRGTGGFGSTGK